MKTKKKYLAPTLDVEQIKLEQSIAQTSATGTATPSNLKLNEEEGSGANAWDTSTF